MPPSLRRSIFRSLALAALLAALPAAAQTPSDESLNRLIDLQNLPAQLRAAMPAATDFANQEIARRINDNTRLNPEQRAALQRAAEQYVAGMNREVFQSEEMLNQMREIDREAMRQTYTQEEVDAMIAFYRTECVEQTGRFDQNYDAADDASNQPALRTGKPAPYPAVPPRSGTHPSRS